MYKLGGWYIGRGAPQKADVPGIDEARGAPPPRSPYLGRSTPNAADTARASEQRDAEERCCGCSGLRRSQGGERDRGGLIWGPAAGISFVVLRINRATLRLGHLPSPPSAHPTLGRPFARAHDLSINLLSSLCRRATNTDDRDSSLLRRPSTAATTREILIPPASNFAWDRRFPPRNSPPPGIYTGDPCWLSPPPRLRYCAGEFFICRRRVGWTMILN